MEDGILRVRGRIATPVRVTGKPWVTVAEVTADRVVTMVKEVPAMGTTTNSMLRLFAKLSKGGYVARSV